MPKESIKQWLVKNGILSVLILILTIGILLNAGDDVHHFDTGEGMVAITGVYSASQTFVPLKANLTRIELYLSNPEPGDMAGIWYMELFDEDGALIYETEGSLEAISKQTFHYQNVYLPVDLKKGREYTVTVTIENSGEGAAAAFYETPAGIGPEEKKVLTYGGTETSDYGLMLGFYYTQVMSRRGTGIVLLLAFLSLIAIWLYVPRHRLVSVLVSVAGLIAVPQVLGPRLETVCLTNHLYLEESRAANLAILYLIEILFLLLLQNLRWAAIAETLFITLVYTANYYVYTLKGMPLSISDLQGAATAAKVMGNYDYSPPEGLALSWIIGALFLAVLAGNRIPGSRTDLRRLWGLRLCSLLAFAGLCWGGWRLLVVSDFLVEKGFPEFHGADYVMTYEFNGYMVGSCVNLHQSRLEKPEGYTDEVAASILENVGSDDIGDLQSMANVILILNESFSDIRTLGNLEISEENLGFWYSLEENTIRGNARVSVLGGGTANSEFELLTGMSLALLPDTGYPYFSYMKRNVPSIVSDMEELGYTTYSIHPESRNNWNRKVVYQFFGFDQSLWIEDFADSEVIHAGASDQETYYRVEQMLTDKDPEERLFIFDLTMQNHGGYGGEPNDVKSVNVYSEEADNYLSCIKKSDEAFEQLITWCSKQEEPIVVCMVGDHQPLFSEDFYTQLSDQFQGEMDRYVTPFVIWANFDIPEETEALTSLNFLGMMTKDAAGIPLSARDRFLKELRENVAAMSQKGSYDSAHNLLSEEAKENLFRDYRIIQYNYLKGNSLAEFGYQSVGEKQK